MERKIETKLINFEGDELLGVRTEEEKIFLCVTKACQDIGLSTGQSDNEVKKIKKNELFIRHESFCYLNVKFDGQVREYFFIEETDVPMWLAQISITPKMKTNNPKAIEKLLNYQDRAAKVLHEAFMGTEEKKEQFFNDMGLTGQIVELKEEVTELKDTINTLINAATINSYQAKQLLKASRVRMNELLGKTHSENYKKNSRTYYKNLWVQFCERFSISEYKDLNPTNYVEGLEYISHWSYNL